MYLARDGEWNKFHRSNWSNLEPRCNEKKPAEATMLIVSIDPRASGKIDRTNFLKIEKENTNENSETA
jgi:hypothetical protein